MRAENPSWPYNAPGRGDPGWSADNGSADDGRPDWTAGDDSWPPNGASPGWPYGEDHPSWPASGGPDWPRAGGGSSPRGREPAAAPRHDPRSPSALPPAPAARVRVPADGGPGGAPQWSGQHAADAAPPSNYEVAFGNGPVQVLLPSAGQEWSAGAGERPAELHDPGQQDAGGFQNADSLRLAERILSDADGQAAGIRQEALDQANAIREAAEREADEVRRQAAYQVDAAREAERQAEEIKRQAEYQANAIREAAAREADELRAGAIRLSAELGQVAAYVTRTLTIPAITAAEPEALPGPELIDDGGPRAQAAQPRDWQPDASPRPQGRPRPLHGIGRDLHRSWRLDRDGDRADLEVRLRRGADRGPDQMTAELLIALAPLALLLAALVRGRYPGERKLDRVRRLCATARPLVDGHPTLLALRVPRSLRREGGELLAWRLAGRGPPLTG